MTFLTMPPLTPRLGPWLYSLPGKYSNRLAEEKGLLSELIQQLPSFDLFCQDFAPEITNGLPFYWAGFQQTTSYTYRFEDLSNLNAIWAGFSPNTWNQIRKAEKILTVRTDLGIDRFVEEHAKMLDPQGSPSYRPKLLYRIDEACERKGCREMFFAEDAWNSVHAVLYVVWDDRCVHCLIAGTAPELRNSGASSLLFWHAMQLASRTGKSFDFEGSMVEVIERHFRNYGARQVPYFRVRKRGSAMKALNAGREFCQALLGK